MGRRAIVPAESISEAGGGGRKRPSPPPKDGNPRGRVPDAPQAAHLRIRLRRIPRCVVSRRTAERETASRGLALPAHAESLALPHASVSAFLRIKLEPVFIAGNGGWARDFPVRQGKKRRNPLWIPSIFDADRSGKAPSRPRFQL